MKEYTPNAIVPVIDEKPYFNHKSEYDYFKKHGFDISTLDIKDSNMPSGLRDKVVSFHKGELSEDNFIKKLWEKI